MSPNYCYQTLCSIYFECVEKRRKKVVKKKSAWNATSASVLALSVSCERWQQRVNGSFALRHFYCSNPIFSFCLASAQSVWQCSVSWLHELSQVVVGTPTLAIWLVCHTRLVVTTDLLLFLHGLEFWSLGLSAVTSVCRTGNSLMFSPVSASRSFTTDLTGLDSDLLWGW